MPKTVQYLRRIVASHETDHELCDVANCFEAARMADELRREEGEWTKHDQQLADKAVMDELSKQHLDPSAFFDDVAAAKAGIATLDEEPGVIERLQARIRITQKLN